MLQVEEIDGVATEGAETEEDKAESGRMNRGVVSEFWLIPRGSTAQQGEIIK